MDRVAPALFSDRPLSQQAYDRLLPFLESLGETEVEEKKTCLHVVAGGRAFLGVHPRKEGLRLNLALSRAIEDSRIVKCDRVSAKRYHNELNFGAAAELDAELADWIKEAYTLAVSK